MADATPTVPIRYRAFLSYAHADRGWGRWLHGRLEQFRLDADLAARATLAGPVDKAGRAKLLPIFIDRGNFSGGQHLTDATIAALDASAVLIVLCSPTAAGRPAVQEEVRLFRHRHPDRPIIPVIIAGTPPECFPPGLRFDLNADGTVGTTPITLLGPDLRDTGDGRALGVAKIVAGLLGLGDANDVYRREERRRRNEGRIRTALVALFLAVAGAGGYFLWDARQKGVVIVQNADEKRQALAIATQLLGANPAAAATPGTEQSLVAALTSLQANAATGDAESAKAYELLKAGKGAEALPLLVAAADAQKRKAAEDRRKSVEGDKKAAKAYRDAAAIAAVAEPGRARELYAEAARLDPDDLDGQLQNAVFQKDAGALNDAETSYRRVLTAAKSGSDDFYLYWARLGLGDIQRQRGDLSVAKATYTQAGEIAAAAVKADPGNDARYTQQWQRDLSVSTNKIGDVLVNQGNLPDALKSFQAGLAIAKALADADKGNAGWQRDLRTCPAYIADAVAD
jgi:tetratricopeptide (TPR) repeat protein